MLLTRSAAHLLLIDLQERLMPAMTGGDAVIANVRILASAAARLGVPVTVTEQYPRGLGATVAAVADAVPDAPRLPKLAFSAAGDAGIAARIAEIARVQGRDEIVIAGVEAHVCVLQSALGLRAQGLRVAVVADATASRRPASAEAALARLAQAGVSIVTTEMVVFEWLGAAGTDDFKALSQAIR